MIDWAVKAQFTSVPGPKSTTLHHTFMLSRHEHTPDTATRQTVRAPLHANCIPITPSNFHSGAVWAERLIAGTLRRVASKQNFLPWTTNCAGNKSCQPACAVQHHNYEINEMKGARDDIISIEAPHCNDIGGICGVQNRLAAQ